MNLATMFTLSRVAIAPFFAYTFMRGYQNNAPEFIWIALVLAIGIELSDLLDGTIARARGEVTDLGKVLDPVADSVSRQTVFISFMLTGIIPLWMYLIFFYRDAFLQLLRIICASNGVVLAARQSGKLKAVLQGVATFAVLIVVLLPMYNITVIPSTIANQHTGFWIVLFAALYTLFSVIDYIIPNRKLIVMMVQKKS